MLMQPLQTQHATVIARGNGNDAAAAQQAQCFPDNANDAAAAGMHAKVILCGNLAMLCLGP